MAVPHLSQLLVLRRCSKLMIFGQVYIQGDSSDSNITPLLWCRRDAALSAAAPMAGVQLLYDRWSTYRSESGCDCSDSNFTPRLWCCREAALTAAACAPDGQSAITGDQGGILRVWRCKGRSLTAQNHAGWACTAKAAASGGSLAVPLHA